MKYGSVSTKKAVNIVLFLLSLATIASSPLLRDGWFISHDVIYHLERLFAVAHEIGQGDYYPRWLSSGAFAKGLPVLNYYSPGFYLVAGYLNVLGIPLILGVKLICFFLFFLGSFGMFLWVREHCDLFGSLIAAAIYTFVPYHFVDIYVRGSMPEFAAIALLPFLFYGIDRMISNDKYGSGYVLTGVFTALIILTHNLSAFMIFPFAFSYFIWRIYTVKPSLRRILLAVLGPLFGVGLSAFFWLPALSEIANLAHFKKSIMAYYYKDHFAYPSEWFSSRWGFWRPSFQIGYALLVFVIISTLTVLFMRSKERSFGFITLTLGTLGLFFTISPSAKIYEHFNLLQYVQFPWRFFGPATLFLTAFTGLSVNFKPIRKITYGPFNLLCFAIALNMFFLQGHNEVRARLSGDIDLIFETRIDTKDIGKMAAKNEYLPRWSKESVVPLKFDQISVAESSTLKVEKLEIRGSKMSFQTESKEEADLVVTSFYFPGWKAMVDGGYRPLSYTSEGFITFKIPPGTHSVQLWFGTTRPRITGWFITVLTLLTIFLFRVRENSCYHVADS